MAFDTSNQTLAVGIAKGGRRREVRFFGTIANRPEAVRKLVEKLAKQHHRLAFCYEAGPTGYGLYRQIRAMGYDCRVVAPSMVPVRPGGHIKTDRRDATTLAALFRAGELTAIWVPDAAHEAMRDLSRGRQAAMEGCGERVSSSSSSCYDMDGFIRPEAIGAAPIADGFPNSGSTTLLSRSCSKS